MDGKGLASGGQEDLAPRSLTRGEGLCVGVSPPRASARPTAPTNTGGQDQGQLSGGPGTRTVGDPQGHRDARGPGGR